MFLNRKYNVQQSCILLEVSNTSKSNQRLLRKAYRVCLKQKNILMCNYRQSLMANHIRFHLLKGIKIPVEAFGNRLLSPAENLVHYLTHKRFLKQCEIAFLLKRNPRTIWTTLTRAERKLKGFSKPTPFLVEKQRTKQEIKEMII